MSRLAAACLAVACLVPALAGNALAQSAPPASHRPPPIPGTLDPATGKFTPDAAGSGSGSSDNVDKGVLNLQFDLDAVHAASVSVACLILVDYTVQILPSGAFIGVGSNRPGPIYLTYDASSHKFSGNFFMDYAVNEGIFPQDVFADIDVTCRYTFDPSTTIYHSVISGKASNLGTFSPVHVTGSMDGQHLN